MTRIVAVEPDVWDWLQYAVTALAAVTAIAVFLAWAVELRRRPEIRFYWRLSPDGDPAHLIVWPPDEVPEIRPGQPFLVEAAIQNTGDKAGRDALINFVAPDCFDLRQYPAPEVELRHAGNDTVGLPPDHRVVFFAVRAEPWTPANWFMRHYRLRYVADQPDQPLRRRLLFTVSDSRFNSRGRRLLPSIVPPLESRGAPLGAPWPPVPAKRRRVRWAPSRASGPSGLLAGRAQRCPRPDRDASRASAGGCGDPVPRLARMASASTSAAAVTLTYRRARRSGVVGHAADCSTAIEPSRTVASVTYTPNHHNKTGQRERPDAPPGLHHPKGELPMMAEVLDPEVLLGLDDAAFRELVNRHVSKRSDPDGAVWAVLHDSALIERTYTVLVEMVRETDSLLTTRAAELEAFRQDCYRRGEAGKRDWHQADADFKVWRGRALGWKRALEPRIMVAKEHRRVARMERNAQQFPRDDQSARATLCCLALAVHHHQAASKAEGISPEPHDEALWAALDQITVPYGALMVTLRSLIDSGAWK